MKNWIIYLISLLYAVTLTGQKREESFQIALRNFHLENYDLCIPYFKRVAFFESDNITNLNYLAESYQKTKSYDNALVHYSLIYNLLSNDSLKNEVCFEMAKCYMLQDKHDYAEIEILNIKEHNNYFKSRKNYYLFLIYLYKGEIELSKNYFLNISEFSDSIINQVESSFSLLEKKIRRTNPKVASALSMVLPGSGQIYSGNFSSGINSLLLTTTALSIFTIISFRYSPIEAILSVFPYYQRYYIGGVINAINFVEEKNRIRYQKTIIELNSIIILENNN
tara:strand:+ start:274 stop:1113 length:840 start_codon:yes stop_codon:yes gene_type:complete